MIKVALCTPSLEGPTKPYIEAMEKSIPLLNEAGYQDMYFQEIGCPYISVARSKCLRKALDNKAEIIVFIDYDLSWNPEDLLNLIKTDGDVVSGLYRLKKDEVEYMGTIECDSENKPKMNPDGTIIADKVPAGFLKITNNAVNKFMSEYPELSFGPKYNLSTDLFNHGAIDGLWYGEDYAFSKRWKEKCGDIKILPNLNLNHHSKKKCYEGNYHEFLLKQPGGSNHG